MEIGMLGGIAGVAAGWLSGYACESEDEDHLADQVAQKVLAQLATKRLVDAR